MREDEDDFIDDMIAYHIIMDDEQRNNGSRPPKRSGGCFSWILMVCAVILIIGLFGSCAGTGKKTSSSYRADDSSSRTICSANGCSKTRMTGSLYCYDYTCHQSGCTFKAVSGSAYCFEHRPETKAAAGTTSTKSIAKTTTLISAIRMKQECSVESFCFFLSLDKEDKKR